MHSIIFGYSVVRNGISAFRDMVTQYRRSVATDPHKHHEATQFSFLLNAVIEKHNKEHDASQAIEPVEMMIDLNKPRSLTSANLRNRLESRKLPSIITKQGYSSIKVTTPSLTSIAEEHSYSESTPNSSRSTVVSEYSARSNDSDRTVELHTSTLISSSNTFSIKTPIAPIAPTSSKSSFKRPEFRGGR